MPPARAVGPAGRPHPSEMEPESMRRILPFAMALAACLTAAPTPAADWPAWRCDAHRSAETAALPAELHLQWQRRLPAPRAAWPESQHKLQFDASYEPVAAGGRLFVPSMVRDSVTAYSLATGERLWRFYADGPVRFAPVAAGRSLYVVTDAGRLICLSQEDGTVRWAFDGAPDGRKVLGNDRLVSMWPARGAPVVADGAVYFAAGIWPFMGTFLYAVDADTGRELWCNSAAGTVWMRQPHKGAVSFAALAPQGYLALAGERLVVPCGRATPAVFDRETGRMLSFNFEKRLGGYAVAARGEAYVNSGSVFALDGGRVLRPFPATIVTDELMIGVIGKRLIGREPAGKLKTRFRAAVPFARAELKAGGRIFGCDGAKIAAVELPAADAETARAVWQAEAPAPVWRMLAADGRLLVVTVAGDLLCYGAAAGEARRYPAPPEAPAAGEDAPGRPGRRTYTVIFGAAGRGQAVRSALADPGCHVLAVDPDPSKVRALREEMDAAGLYGRRIAALVGDAATLRLPRYFAHRVLLAPAEAARAPGDAELAGRVFSWLRPYGGRAELGGADAARVEAVAAMKLPGSGVEAVGSGEAQRLVLIRRGPLPGSAPWTHQYADATNSVIGADDRVRAPLGLLWFGGPPNDDILPRHGHGPSPQVAGGRLVIEGPDILRAVDVYTGALLWQRRLPRIGEYHDNTDHQPGAGGIGGNYVTLADAVYVAYGKVGLRLDPCTGETVREFALPEIDGARPHWGYIGVSGDVLLAGAAPLDVRGKYDRRGRKLLGVTVADNARYGVASTHLVAMDRHSGKVLWQRRAERNFRHNAIVAGAGKVFCLDRISDQRREFLKRRGRQTDAGGELLALELATGKVLWRVERDIFGTWLGYSRRHDVLLQAGSRFRDREPDEAGRGMAAYRGADGRLLWQDLKVAYGGPPMLWGERIICQGPAFELLTGKPARRVSAVTGAEHAWDFQRTYGCNTAIGSRHLLTFRSGAAGYYDLLRDGGTGNFGGFKSSCTSNLIAADGVLSAPDYTRTCTCAYQNQASLALVPMPDAETWTFSSYGYDGKPVRRVGLNFGAPGDRRTDGGTLWLDCPSVGGRSPDVPVRMQPKAPATFRHHSLRLHGGALPWVAGSGVEGVRRITVSLGKDAGEAAYTVRLVFAEMNEAVEPGERVFDVALNGRKALEAFDPVAAAGGARRGVVREVRDIPGEGELTVELTAAPGKLPATLSGLEIIRQP